MELWAAEKRKNLAEPKVAGGAGGAMGDPGGAMGGAMGDPGSAMVKSRWWTKTIIDKSLNEINKIFLYLFFFLF